MNFSGNNFTVTPAEQCIRAVTTMLTADVTMSTLVATNMITTTDASENVEPKSKHGNFITLSKDQRNIVLGLSL